MTSHDGAEWIHPVDRVIQLGHLGMAEVLCTDGKRFVGDLWRLTPVLQVLECNRGERYCMEWLAVESIRILSPREAAQAKPRHRRAVRVYDDFGQRLEALPMPEDIAAGQGLLRLW